VPRLIVIKGTDEGQQFELGDGVHSVGRDASNHVRLHDTEVMRRRHAEFRRTPDGYRLTDLNSANGTFVNNQKITDVLLQPGDHVQIGQTVLVYVADSGEAQPPALAAGTHPRVGSVTREEDQAFSSHTVITRYPAPIAVAYRRFCDYANPNDRLLKLFATVEAVARYLVTLGVSDLLHCLAEAGGSGAALPESEGFAFLRTKRWCPVSIAPGSALLYPLGRC
jgi:Inner membrane component of T3SS, cytoplasmic domain